jgi:hypothetical protein
VIVGIIYNSSIVRNGLVLHLDAANPKSYPGSGNTWFDISGAGNHFTLFNNPVHSAGHFTFNGSTQYAISSATINMSTFQSVTVEIGIRNITVGVGMAWEHTADWNTNAGGFGLYHNSQGGAQVTGWHHTNHNTYGVLNYQLDTGTTWNIHTNIFSRIVDSTGRLAYGNGSLLATGSPTSGSTVFANSFFHIAVRGTTSAFSNSEISFIRIYNRKLSAQEISQNFEATRGRYGI